MTLVLASSSIYRKQLLKRLNIDFECYSPNINETINKHLSPFENAEIIAQQKALKTAQKYPDSVIIASDQICCIDNLIYGKPGTYEKAFHQLSQASGKMVFFYTAVHVLHMEKQKHQAFHYVDKTEVHFKNLKDNEIKNYLKYEQPYNCAGSFKAESLGICLFDKIISEDPSALIGLPLIKLCNILTRVGLNPLGDKIE